MESHYELPPIAAEHAERPRNVGPLSDADGHAAITGPCGDTMEFWLRVRGGRIEEASFQTTGCCSSLACGSVATELAAGKTPEDASRISQRDIMDACGGLPPEVQHCALLAADTLRAACENCLLHGKWRLK